MRPRPHPAVRLRPHAAVETFIGSRWVSRRVLDFCSIKCLISQVFLKNCEACCDIFSWVCVSESFSSSQSELVFRSSSAAVSGGEYEILARWPAGGARSPHSCSVLRDSDKHKLIKDLRAASKQFSYSPSADSYHSSSILSSITTVQSVTHSMFLLKDGKKFM